MNDERIIAYLRSRVVVEPPPGLGAEVSAAVDAALVPWNPFSSLLPTVAAIAIVGVVAAALLVTQRPAGGPATSEAGLPSPSATAHPSFPIAADDPRFAECAGSAYPDEVIAAFPMVGADYKRHLPNMGLAPELEEVTAAFVVVFEVGVKPPGVLGGPPRQSSPAPLTGHTVCIYLGQHPDGYQNFYVNVDIAGMRADIGSVEPSAPPSLTPSAVPSTSPQPGYVAVEGLPITVLDNAEADELFRDVQTCTSVAGYTVTFPATWYTNAASRDVPACSWFGPEPFDGSIRPVAVKPPPPEGAWLFLEVVDGGAGYTTITPIYMSEPITIGGYEGHRAEFGPSTLYEITSRPDYRAYWYVITVGEHFPTFIAYTNVDYADGYPLAKAVMDRMVASITFEPR